MDRKEMAEINNKINELRELAIYENLIKNNYVEFTADNIKYKVRRPNLDDKDKLKIAQSKKFNELISDKDWKFRDIIIKETKEKGKDLKEFDKEVSRIDKQIMNLYEKLGQTGDKFQIDPIKQDIGELKLQKQNLINEKQFFLQFSIEDYLDYYSKLYLGYLLTEKLEKDKWISAFESEEEIRKCVNRSLVATIAFYINKIVFLGDLTDERTPII